MRRHLAWCECPDCAARRAVNTDARPTADARRARAELARVIEAWPAPIVAAALAAFERGDAVDALVSVGGLAVLAEVTVFREHDDETAPGMRDAGFRYELPDSRRPGRWKWVAFL